MDLSTMSDFNTGMLGCDVLRHECPCGARLRIGTYVRASLLIVCTGLVPYWLTHDHLGT